MDDVVADQGSDDRQQHPGFARLHAAPCAGGMAHPHQRQDEERGCPQIKKFDRVLPHDEISRLLNIRIIRSVIR